MPRLDETRLVTHTRAMLAARREFMAAAAQIPHVPAHRLEELRGAYDDAKTLVAWELAYQLIPEEVPVTRAILDEQRATVACAAVPV
jgi:hypothetical protein